MSTRTIQKFKNGSTFVVIPPVMLENFDLQKGSQVELKQVSDGILIKKLKKIMMSDVGGGLRNAARMLNEEVK